MSLGASTLQAKPLILIVDDLADNRLLLRELISTIGYDSIPAENGLEAMEKIRSQGPDMVLLDIMMPVMNGFAVLEAMRSDPSMRDLPVIVLSALDDLEHVVQGIRLGADDYVAKPFNATLLATRIEACLKKKHWRDQAELYRQMIEAQNNQLQKRVEVQVKLIAEQMRMISSAQVETIFALSKLAEYRDPETGSHLERMREYCRALSEQMSRHRDYAHKIDSGFTENIYAAAPLHDIGKVGIPDSVLLKPGKLTDEEFAIMKRHPQIGAETLRAVHDRFPGNSFIFMGIEIAQFHHEKWDGSGYPRRLRGTDIPVSARILALADVYDALTSKRCYKDAFSHEKSCGIILEGRGTHFDPDVVDAFLGIEERIVEIKERMQENIEEVVGFVAESVGV